MAVSSIKIQDLHIEDKDLWAQFQEKYKAGNYTEAWQLIADTQFNNKKNIESIWNGVTSDLVYVQGLNDEDFGKNKIRVATEMPTDIEDGQIWFQLTNATDGLITINQCTSATDKTNNILYPKINSTDILGGTDMTAYPISPKNVDTAISKLADGIYDVSVTTGTDNKWVQEDGTTFGASGGQTTYQTLVYQNGIYLASINESFYKSTDGLNWELTGSPTYKYEPSRLVAGDGYFYCFGRSADALTTIYVYRSSDAVTWTKVVSIGSNSYAWNLYYVNGHLIVIRDTPGALSFLYSTDYGDTFKTTPQEIISSDRTTFPHSIEYWAKVDTYYLAIPMDINATTSTVVYKQKTVVYSNWTMDNNMIVDNYFRYLRASEYYMLLFPNSGNAVWTWYADSEGNIRRNSITYSEHPNWNITNGGWYHNYIGSLDYRWWWMSLYDNTDSIYKNYIIKFFTPYDIKPIYGGNFEQFYISSSSEVTTVLQNITSNNVDAVVGLKFDNYVVQSKSVKIKQTSYTTHTLTFTNAKGDTLLAARID